MSACFRLACIQVNATTEMVANLEVTSELIKKAVDLGAQFVSLPECVALFEPDADALRRKSATEDDHPALNFFRECARGAAIWLHVGSLAVLDGEDRIYNRTFLIRPDGSIHARYDKILMLIWGAMTLIANLIPIDPVILLLPRIFPGDGLG